MLYDPQTSGGLLIAVAEKDAELCEKVLREHQSVLNFQEIHVSTDVAKVSIVGSGMVNNAGVAADMFEALAQSRINIHMISTSEIKISVLIDKVNSERALRAIHDKFFDI
jgi:aspartate kinase